ncbi:MAG: SDR family NAD(P)-dependent oxidoreductase [Terracidiphilus sp.]
MCYSASIGRAHHNHRLAVVASSNKAMVDALTAFGEQGQTDSGVYGKLSARPTRGPVFVFTGMGPQWWGMGKELLANEPVFREAAFAVDQIFQSLSGWSLLAEMRVDKVSSRMNETQVAQPANFLLQVALTALLRSWGITPGAIVGHSAGEVAAAHAAGVHELKDAVSVIFHRSRLQMRVSGKGRMLAVGLSLNDAQSLILGYDKLVSVAAVNSRSSLAFSGCAATLQEIAAGLENRGVFNRFIQGDIPYHSQHMDDLIPELHESLKEVQSHPPQVPFYSSVTGRLYGGPCDARYWCNNIRKPVLFADASDSIVADGFTQFLEIGPHPVLAASIKECLRHHGQDDAVMACLRREEPEGMMLRRCIASLYVAGHNADWLALSGGSGRRVKLPTYPWQRERLWFPESATSVADRLGRPDHPLLGMRVAGPDPSWENDLSLTYLGYLSSHVVDNTALFPASGFLEQGLAIHSLLGSAKPDVIGAIEDVEILRALVISAENQGLVRTQFDSRTREYKVFSRSDGDSVEWTLHATGRISEASSTKSKRIPIEQIKNACQETIDKTAFYARLAEFGLQYGEPFQRVERLWRSKGQAVSELKGDAHSNGTTNGYKLHPALLDGAIQSLVAAIDTDQGPAHAYVPVGVQRITWRGGTPNTWWSHAEVVNVSEGSIKGNISLCDQNGEIIAELTGIECRVLPSVNRDPAEWIKRCTYRPEWIRTDRDRSTAQSNAVRWMLFTDEGVVGEQVAQELLLRIPEAEIELISSASVSGEIERAFTEHSDFQRIVYLWPLNDVENSACPTDSRSAIIFLSLMKAIAQRPEGDAPRVYVITNGAQAIVQGDAVCVSQATMIGLARTAFTEHPEMRCTLIDIDTESSSKIAAEIAEELLCDSNETEIGLRGAGRYVYRLAPYVIENPAGDAPLEPTIAAADAEAFRLKIGTPGRIESLKLHEIQRRPPGQGEIEIQILAAGLNFKDVLKAMSLLPAKALERSYHGTGLGIEAAGIVSAVGEGVTSYRVGDSLVASLQNSFSSHVTVPVDSLFAVPKLASMTFAEAASIPVVFMTAYYALHDLAHLTKGETVLIHAAAGGVGLAAIQVAKWLGARVIATAGSEEKRNYIRSLGVDHVLNSRTLDFADEVMALTSGGGVDVILNSLSGEALLKSLSVVAPLGRFIEIGKRDIVENSRLPMLAFNRNLSFMAFDLDRIMTEQPDRIRELLKDVWTRFGTGDFTMIPIEVIPVAQIAEGFRRMAQAKQVGKIVISFEDTSDLHVVPERRSISVVKPDATYMITGGCGGFGLEVAKWMAREGARHLLLLGRSGARSARSQRVIEDLKSQGISVVVRVADVADEHQVSETFGFIETSMPRLGGIVHAAGVLDDAILINLDADRFRRVVAGKAAGAWLLHKNTLDMDLQFFVLFSSISALVGNAGQANYAAANTFLDALAHHRQSMGLIATSINWGAIADIGMAAENKVVEAHLARLGINLIAPRDAMAALSLAVRDSHPQIGFMDVDWDVWRRSHPSTAASPKFASIIKERDTADLDSSTSLRSILLKASPNERTEIAGRAVAGLVSEIMRIPVDKIDLNIPLMDMGIDSLMAVELQAGIQTKFGIECSILQLQKGGDFAGLARTLLSQMDLHTEQPEYQASVC